jgi:hypothetical protein
MNAFNLTVVIIAIGVVIVACLSGICSLMLTKRGNEHTDAETSGPFARLWSAYKRRLM